MYLGEAVTNMKEFDEKVFAEGISFICLFQHSPSLEGSSQQPCPVDGTQQQQNTSMGEVWLCHA